MPRITAEELINVSAWRHIVFADEAMMRAATARYDAQTVERRRDAPTG